MESRRAGLNAPHAVTGSSNGDTSVSGDVLSANLLSRMFSVLLAWTFRFKSTNSRFEEELEMKMRLMKSVLLGALVVSGVVGCGPEVAVVAPVVMDAAAAAGTIGGTVWLYKSIENVSLDTEKKELEIEAIRQEARRRNDAF